ncbi:MAG: hypothetical protein HDT46_04690 [Ruminococcaceae bacterium]|nr:hypothetical protein [Oscillospiraceae bacterium]
MQNLDKIARFEEAINSAAEAEINALIEAAKAKAAEAVACADEEYLERSYQLVSSEAKNIKRKLAHEVSQKSFETSKEIFAYRNKCVDEFFGDLAREIIEYSKTAEYNESLSEILSEIDGEKSFGDNAVIYVKSEDVEKVKKLYPSIKVQADKNIKLGGATVFYPDASIYIDKTYDNAFEQQKTEFVNNSFMQL